MMKMALALSCRRHGSRHRNGDNSVFCSEDQPGKHKLCASNDSRTSADIRGIKERRTLEKLQDLLSPFRLPRTLEVSLVGCNGEAAPFMRMTQ